jgi:probable phosphoglycerate mutase
MEILHADSELAHRSQDRYRLPQGARQILLIRHGSSVGETIDTIELDALTISDPCLSPAGESQAELLADYLAEEEIAAIFVTPLRRTHQTAAPLAARRELPTIEIADLREVHLGDWEHSFYGHARAGHPLISRMFTEETWEVVPNAEPVSAFAARVRRGIEAIVNAVPPGTTVAAFSHAATIAELCRQATGSRPFAFMAPENSSVSRLVISERGEWKLRSFNDVAHLGYP